MWTSRKCPPPICGRSASTLYQRKTVLAITGNYYASYSGERMNGDARLKETFNQVVVPILQAEVPHFPDDSEFSAYAIEVSHHVRKKVMNMSSEIPENVAVIIPVSAAQKFVDAKTDEERQSAVLDAEIFLNGEPHSLWLGDGAPPEEWQERNSPPAQMQTVAMPGAPTAATPSGTASVSNALLKPTPARIITPESLVGLQRQNQDAIDRMVKGLDSQAHFLPYAPPSFIGFRQGRYLAVVDQHLAGSRSRQLSLQTCRACLRRAHLASHTAAAGLFSCRMLSSTGSTSVPASTLPGIQAARPWSFSSRIA